jgi:hypothetical protein
VQPRILAALYHNLFRQDVYNYQDADRPSSRQIYLESTPSLSQPVSLGEGRSLRTGPPELSEFNLPTGFDFTAFIERQRRFEELAVWIAAGSTASFALLYAVGSGFGAFGAFIVFAITVIPLALVLGIPVVFLLPYVLSALYGDAGLRSRVAAFLTAKSEWEYYNETTGEGFWQDLRGVELEGAVARLFSERGWMVGTTAVTGDGGIDLVLSRGGHEIWCQCKGYAKPVSVVAVREIAGVCSASNAQPMLIVVNGLTKPALAEAASYSVAVWDSQELAAFAREEQDFESQPTGSSPPTLPGGSRRKFARY